VPVLAPGNGKTKTGRLWTYVRDDRPAGDMPIIRWTPGSPTDLEWKLATRGVDGRVYPWGNQFDNERANVSGLPQKGEPPPTLKPLDAYPGEVSPFGLVDTVGNAGDWVANDSGSYERVFMGAT
jgi:formylglycine-generating enzyme required for sulfatase activity